MYVHSLEICGGRQGLSSAVLLTQSFISVWTPGHLLYTVELDCNPIVFHFVAAGHRGVSAGYFGGYSSGLWFCSSTSLLSSPTRCSRLSVCVPAISPGSFHSSPWRVVLRTKIWTHLGVRSQTPCAWLVSGGHCGCPFWCST
jgi:hypothetical protein